MNTISIKIASALSGPNLGRTSVVNIVRTNSARKRNENKINNNFRQKMPLKIGLEEDKKYLQDKNLRTIIIICTSQFVLSVTVLLLLNTIYDYWNMHKKPVADQINKEK